MKIGFDLDGLVVNYQSAACDLLEEMFGKRFPADMDRSNPPYWYFWYPAFTKGEVAAFMHRVEQSPNFWMMLKPHNADAESLSLCIESLEHEHEVYFVTNRSGVRAKRQTEMWLTFYMPYNDPAIRPTVLLVADKGAAAKALKLDAYIDDSLDNIKGVLEQSPTTRAYLLNKNYNQGDASVKAPVTRTISVKEGPMAGTMPVYDYETRTATRVNTLGEMLTRELVVQ